MRYRVSFTDGSQEVVSGAQDIAEAREMAKETYDLAPVQNVIALDDDDEDEDDDDDEDAENPAGADEEDEA